MAASSISLKTKIYFLVGNNPHQTAPHFSRQLSDALQRQGIETRLYWIDEGHFFHAFYDILEDPPDCTCSFSQILVGQKRLGDLWRIPHLSFLIDSAIYFTPHFEGNYSWISCVDQDNCAFVRSRNFNSVFFLPHAAEKEILTLPHDHRTYEVAFFGSCVDIDACERRWRGYPMAKKERLYALAERVLSPQGISLYQAIQEIGVHQEEFLHYYQEIELYIRGKDRIELIRSIQDQEVHIWGPGPWKRYCPQAIVHSSISFEETLLKMRETKIVLNSSPSFKKGAHERLFYALLSGCCVLTGESAFVNHHFVPGKEILTYRFGEYSHDLKGAFSSWKEIALAGQQKVLTEHTWDHRAKDVIDFLISKKNIK